MSRLLKEHNLKYKPHIVVESPETRQARGTILPKSVMTFAVVVEIKEGSFQLITGPLSKQGVRKRYSDFEALRTRLERRYGREGVLVPPLPPKKRMGNQQVDFIKHRMKGLSLFLDGLASSPFLMRDPLTHKFLTETTESDGSIGEIALPMEDDEGPVGVLERSSSQRLSLSSSSLAANNQGLVVWNEFLSSFALPADPDTLLNKVRQELDIVERVLKDVFEASRGLMAGFAQYSQALQSFSHCMHVLAEGEKTVELLNKLGTQQKATTYYEVVEAASPAQEEGEKGEGDDDEKREEKEEDEIDDDNNNNNHDDEEEDTLSGFPLPITTIPTLASHTADLFSHTAQGYLAAPDQISFLFSSLLEYELFQVQHLKTLLAGREELNVSILKLQKKLYTLQSVPPDRRNQPECDLYENKLSQEEMRYYKYTKALLCFTVPQVARTRTRNLNRAFANLAAINTAAASCAFGRALTYLETLRWEAQDIVECANEAAAALVIPPVPGVVVRSSAGERGGGSGGGGGGEGGGKEGEKSSVGGGNVTGPTTGKGKKSGGTSAAAAAAAAAHNPAPGSFLKEGEKKKKKQNEEESDATNASTSSSSKVTDSVITAAPIVGAGGGGGGGKAPWESDDEADNPFEAVEKEQKK